QGDSQAGREKPRAGPRNDVRTDRRRGARHSGHRHQGDGRRHRQHAVRSRDLCVTIDSRRGCRHRDGLSQARRQGKEHRGASPRSRSGRHRAPRGQVQRAGSPNRTVTIQDVALAAYTNCPEGMEYGLESVHYYDPPNLTYPYGSYVVVVEVDAETGVWKVQRMVALDDCGVRINPMIVEGQI